MIFKSSKEISITSESETTIKAMRPLKEALNPRAAKFTMLDIPENTVVRIHQGGEPGFRYELRQGRLVKIADGRAIAAAGDARFRQPESMFWYYTIWIGALIGVLCLAWWWNMRSRAN